MMWFTYFAPRCGEKMISIKQQQQQNLCWQPATAFKSIFHPLISPLHYTRAKKLLAPPSIPPQQRNPVNAETSWPPRNENTLVSSLPEGLTIGKKCKWRIGKLLGSGTCGSVHELHPIDQSHAPLHQQYAIKIAELSPTGKNTRRGKKTDEDLADTLYHEHLVLANRLGALRGTYIPDIPGYGGSDPPSYGEISSEKTTYRFLVMQRMSSSLSSWAPLIDGENLSLGDMALQMLECVQSLHESKLLHADLKVDNFMVARPLPSGSHSLRREASMAKDIRLIDFGLSECFLNPTHRKDVPTGGIVGTPLYCSCRVMEGHTPSRRDDMESLGYVLMDLLLMSKSGGTTCQLPWKDCGSDEEILRMKTEFLSSGKGFYNEMWSDDEDAKIIFEYLTVVRALRYSQTPKYRQLKQLLGKLRGGRNDTSAKQHPDFPFHSLSQHPIKEDCVPLPAAVSTDSADSETVYFEPELLSDEIEMEVAEEILLSKVETVIHDQEIRGDLSADSNMEITEVMAKKETMIPKEGAEMHDQGMRGILIVKGVYKNKLAFLTGKETEQMICVRLENPNGHQVKIRKNSLGLELSRTLQTQPAAESKPQPPDADCEGPVLQRTIKGGKYKGRIAYLQRATEKMVYVHLDSPNGEVTRIQKSSWGDV